MIMISVSYTHLDAILIETIFDTLNAKAAIFAAEQAMKVTGVEVPVMLSVTQSTISRIVHVRAHRTSLIGWAYSCLLYPSHMLIGPIQLELLLLHLRRKQANYRNTWN